LLFVLAVISLVEEELGVGSPAPSSTLAASKNAAFMIFFSGFEIVIYFPNAVLTDAT
jgi:hypothetical protein